MTPSSRTILLVSLAIILLPLSRATSDILYVVVAASVLIYVVWSVISFIRTGRAVRRLQVQRTLPRFVRLGRPAEVSLELRNISSTGIRIEEVREAVPAHCRLEETRPKSPMRIGPSSSVLLHFRLLALAVGPANVSGPTIRFTDPAGLFSGSIAVGLSSSLEVMPPPSSRGPMARILTAVGSVSARMKGRGTDYAATRPYIAGDEMRAIEWKATARLQRLLTKEFYRDESVPLIILLDGARRMARRDQESPSTRFAQMVALGRTISEVALGEGDEVGIGLYDEGSVRAFVPPRSGRDHLALITRSLLSWRPDPPGGTPAGGEAPDIPEELFRRVRRLEAQISEARRLGKQSGLERLMPYYLEAKKAYRTSLEGKGSYQVAKAILSNVPPPALVVVMTDLAGDANSLMETCRLLESPGNRVILTQLWRPWALPDLGLEEAYARHRTNREAIRRFAAAGLTVIETNPTRLLHDLQTPRIHAKFALGH